MNAGVSSEKEKVKESQSQSRSVTPPPDINFGCRAGGITLAVTDPLVMWNSFKEMYEHQRTVILPKARYDWMHFETAIF